MELDGREVAAVAAGASADAVWNTYVAVDDADRVASQVTRAGGVVSRALADAPGTWNFSDLQSDDPQAAKAFYALACHIQRR